MENVIGFFVLPSNLIMLLLASGFILILSFNSSKLKISGRFCVILAGLLYIIFSSGPVSRLLLGNLERQFPPILEINTVKDIHTIVVLTGYADQEKQLPLSSRVNMASAHRLLEAMRIHNEIPDTKIIISGYKYIPDVMREVLISLGLDDSIIFTENHSRNTYTSAINLSPMLKENEFILVTSAGHMPRAIKVFKKLGMNPIPAPTNHFIRTNIGLLGYLPTPNHLTYSDLAIHEYVGLYWYWVNGHI